MPAAMMVCCWWERGSLWLNRPPVLRDSFGTQPPASGPQPWRLHYLPRPARRPGRQTDRRQCRSHRALSWRRRADPQQWLSAGPVCQSTYTEGIFQLAAGQQLTLLTDGVVEARDKSGALFGFERTAAMSSQSADQIAKTAELFGQDDDITVLTLERMVTA